MSKDQFGFELEFSFDIDNGELADVPQHGCFVLGFELGQLWVRLQFDSMGWEQFLHTENINRCLKACEKHGRKAHMRSAMDQGEEWMILTVEPKR